MKKNNDLSIILAKIIGLIYKIMIIIHNLQDHSRMGHLNRQKDFCSIIKSKGLSPITAIIIQSPFL